MIFLDMTVATAHHHSHSAVSWNARRFWKQGGAALASPAAAAIRFEPRGAENDHREVPRCPKRCRPIERSRPGPPLPAHVRGCLEGAVATLHRADRIPTTILEVSRLLEGKDGLLGTIAKQFSRKLKSSDLMGQIEELRENGLIPGEIAADLHWIRVYANKARHRGGGRRPDTG